MRLILTDEELEKLTREELERCIKILDALAKAFEAAYKKANVLTN